MGQKPPQPGIVYLVGAGPGDPGLITVKGLHLLRTADVVVYDYLASERFLDEARPEAELVYVGKKGGDHTWEQDEINRYLARRAREGKKIVRLKGGDPYLFGRGAEEAQELRSEGIEFEVVPGVTSAIAAPAYAGIPVTHRDHASMVSFITGHEDPRKEESAMDWEALAKYPGTLVFLMGIKNLARICESLIAHGKAPDTPAALVRWGTTPRQESLLSDLTNVADAVKKAGLKPPAVFVVGSVASLRGELDFFERKPLFGKRILVTRSREQSRKMADRIIELGGDPILLPTIKMVPPDDLRPLDDSLDRIGEYDWIIFTSVNGVEFFFRRFFERYDDLRLLAGPKFAAIGPITAAAIRARGLRAELTAKEFVAEGLLADFPEHEISGRRFLIPRAQKARDILPDGLTARGGAVDVVSVYKTVQPDAEEIRPVIASLGETRLDAITFTSSSTVTHFLHMIKGTGYEKAPLTAVASIGPITSKTLKDNDMAVDVEAGEYTIDGLIDALVEYFRTR